MTGGGRETAANRAVRPVTRSDGRQGPQEHIVETLQSLEDDGRIEGVDDILCGECVCPWLKTAETDIAQLLLDRYEAFEGWADSNDRDLVGFEKRDVESLLTGGSVTGIVFPRIALAEYREGELAFVAPSTNGTEQTGVVDRFDVYS